MGENPFQKRFGLSSLLNPVKPEPAPNWFDLFSHLASTTNKKPSDIVQVSGIYKVEHDTVHTQPHEVTCVKNEKFPPCRNCGNKITYNLVTAAVHLSEDYRLG
jgi:hypothetical protein